MQSAERYRCHACGTVFASETGRRPSPGTPRPEGRFAERFLSVPEPAALRHLIGYGVMFILLLYFGLSYIAAPIPRSQVPPTLVHRLIQLVDLVFHEAGHVLFMILSDLLHTLGGSFMQVAVPMVCALAFIGPYRDPLGAAFATWWTGQSLIDLAPYIDDARAQRMILLGGITGQDAPGAHDWNVILADFGLLEYDHTLAQWAHLGGSLLIATAILWSGTLLVRCFVSWQET